MTGLSPQDAAENRFEVPGPLDVRVHLDYGLVRVWARTDGTASVRVGASITGRQQDLEAAGNVRVGLSAGTLEVRGAASGWRRFVRPGSAEVDIEVPPGSRVTATTGYASLEVAGDVDSCSVRSTGGDIRVEQAQSARLATKYGSVVVGDVSQGASVESTHGSVRVRSVAGTSSLSTTSGDVVLDAAVGGELTIRSAYGAVQVGELVSGACAVTTSYGAVDVGVPRGTIAYLDVQSHHGSVRSELDPTGTPATDAQRATVRARTAYGAVTIRRATTGFRSTPPGRSA